MLADGISRKLLAPLKKHCGRHNKAWCAESALDGAFLNKSFLNPGKFAVFLKTFQGADILSLSPDCQINTGVNGLAVNDHSAGTAFTYFTAFLHRGKPKAVSQHVKKGFSHIHILSYLFSVYDTLYQPHILFHDCSPPVTFSASDEG